MTLPFRRHSRPRGPARLALAGDFPGTGEPATGPLQRDGWDGTTIEFAGTSGAGLPGGIAYDAATSHGTSPLARLRARARYQPPEPAPAGYADTTGPLPVIGRPAVSIGDALTHDDACGPKLAPLPCGHCGTPPSVPARILDRTRIIGHVNWLAARDGWKFDTDLIWTCPACQAGDEWKARQGQLELHRFDEPCDRHDDAPRGKTRPGRVPVHLPRRGPGRRRHARVGGLPRLRPRTAPGRCAMTGPEHYARGRASLDLVNATGPCGMPDDAMCGHEAARCTHARVRRRHALDDATRGCPGAATVECASGRGHMTPRRRGGDPVSMSELYPSGPGTPVTARPARCTCTRPVAATLGETLGCPRRWWPVPGQGWAHAPGWAR